MKIVTESRECAHELHGALHVDVHHHVPARGQHPFDLAAQGAVQVAVDHRGLGERAVLPLGEELGAADEIIIATVHFRAAGAPVVVHETE